MRALTVAHLSDTHLGMRGGGAPAAAFREAVERVAERKPDLLVHTGDLFHYSKPSSEDLLTAVDGVRRLAGAGVETVLLCGNHDHSRVEGFLPAHLILKRFGCHIFRDAEKSGREQFRVEFPRLGVTVWGVPHHRDTQEEVSAFREALERAADEARSASGVRLLLLHQAFAGKGVPSLYERADLPDVFDWVFAGHQHVPELFLDGGLKGSVAGSTVLQSINELNDGWKPRGFYVVEFPERTATFEPLTSVVPYFRFDVNKDEERVLDEVAARVARREPGAPPPVVVFKGVRREGARKWAEEGLAERGVADGVGRVRDDTELVTVREDAGGERGLSVADLLAEACDDERLRDFLLRLYEKAEKLAAEEGAEELTRSVDVEKLRRAIEEEVEALIP